MIQKFPSANDSLCLVPTWHAWRLDAFVRFVYVETHPLPERGSPKKKGMSLDPQIIHVMNTLLQHLSSSTSTPCPFVGSSSGSDWKPSATLLREQTYYPGLHALTVCATFPCPCCNKRKTPQVVPLQAMPRGFGTVWSITPMPRWNIRMGRVGHFVPLCTTTPRLDHSHQRCFHKRVVAKFTRLNQ